MAGIVFTKRYHKMLFGRVTWTACMATNIPWACYIPICERAALWQGESPLLENWIPTLGLHGLAMSFNLPQPVNNLMLAINDTYECIRVLAWNNSGKQPCTDVLWCMLTHQQQDTGEAMQPHGHTQQRVVLELDENILQLLSLLTQPLGKPSLS